MTTFVYLVLLYESEVLRPVEEFDPLPPLPPLLRGSHFRPPPERPPEPLPPRLPPRPPRLPPRLPPPLRRPYEVLERLFPT